MLRNIRTALGALTALAMLACSGDDPTPATPYYLNLYGTVSSPTGAPLGGAHVRVSHAPRECTLAGIGARFETVTAPNGAYRIELLIGTSTGGCFTIAVDPPNQNLQADSVTRTDFAERFRRHAPYDSVAVDMELKAK